SSTLPVSSGRQSRLGAPVGAVQKSLLGRNRIEAAQALAAISARKVHTTEDSRLIGVGSGIQRSTAPIAQKTAWAASATAPNGFGRPKLLAKISASANGSSSRPSLWDTKWIHIRLDRGESKPGNCPITW